MLWIPLHLSCCIYCHGRCFFIFKSGHCHSCKSVQCTASILFHESKRSANRWQFLKSRVFNHPQKFTAVYCSTIRLWPSISPAITNQEFQSLIYCWNDASSAFWHCIPTFICMLYTVMHVFNHCVCLLPIRSSRCHANPPSGVPKNGMYTKVPHPEPRMTV